MRLFWIALLVAPAALAADDPAVKAKLDEAELARKQADYHACVKTLESAIASVKHGDSLEASAYKLLAICQYKAGRKTAAAANFRAALQTDPKLTLTEGDTGGDETIVSFFTDVTGEKSRAKALVEDAIVDSAKSEPAGPTRTSIVVFANAPGAAVLIDGIFAGHAGDTIEVDAGAVELEVNAPGYESKKLKVDAKAEVKGTVRVELVKEARKVGTDTSLGSPMEPAPPAATQD